MTALEVQLDELLEYSLSQHGFWLINHRSIIEDVLKSGIMSFGIQGMKARLNDIHHKDTRQLYKLIKDAK